MICKVCGILSNSSFWGWPGCKSLLNAGLSALGLPIDNRWVASLSYFLFDVIKIGVLLCVLIFLISYVQSFFPPERSRKILGCFRGIPANIIAALLGTVTPFCSCSYHSAVYRVFLRQGCPWA